jgi:hypothetical protein
MIVDADSVCSVINVPRNSWYRAIRYMPLKLIFLSDYYHFAITIFTIIFSLEESNSMPFNAILKVYEDIRDSGIYCTLIK